MLTIPLAGSNSPAIVRNSVVFPEPEDPVIAMKDPGPIERFKSSSRLLPPNPKTDALNGKKGATHLHSFAIPDFVSFVFRV